MEESYGFGRRQDILEVRIIFGSPSLTGRLLSICLTFQARNVFQKLKEGLVYKDEEVLETGMLKVQPLQYLGG